MTRRDVTARTWPRESKITIEKECRLFDWLVIFHSTKNWFLSDDEIFFHSQLAQAMDEKWICLDWPITTINNTMFQFDFGVLVIRRLVFNRHRHHLVIAAIECYEKYFVDIWNVMECNDWKWIFKFLRWNLLNVISTGVDHVRVTQFGTLVSSEFVYRWRYWRYLSLKYFNI